MDFSKEKPLKFLPIYAQICSDCVIDLSVSTITDMARKLSKYYKANAKKREELRFENVLEYRWYEGLKKGIIDYGVYSEDIYLSDMFACWYTYSRGYLKGIDKFFKKNKINVESVIDLGCGAGLTTATLKQIFPNAKVVGTNLENTKQMRICRYFANVYGFNVVSDYNALKTSDFVLASEYFEHIEAPIEHLNEVLNKIKPKYFIVANAFGTISVGHFYNYKIEGQLIEGKKVQKIFDRTMRERGYIKLKTGFWNNRPTIWKKIEVRNINDYI